MPYNLASTYQNLPANPDLQMMLSPSSLAPAVKEAPFRRLAYQLWKQLTERGRKEETSFTRRIRVVVKGLTLR